MRDKLWFQMWVGLVVLLVGCSASGIHKTSADDLTIVGPVSPVIVPGGKDVPNAEASFTLGRVAVWLGACGGLGLCVGVLYLIRKHSRIPDSVVPPRSP